MQPTALPVFPILLFLVCALALAIGLLIAASVLNPGRAGAVKQMPYESGMDPIHDTHRRFDVRFYLLAIAFLVFDVELLFLYPWAVAAGSASIDSREGSGFSVRSSESPSTPSAVGVAPSALPLPLSANRHAVFAAVMIFVALLTIGFVYDWRKGVFQWR